MDGNKGKLGLVGSELMLAGGNAEADVRASLGESWLRVCGQVWK